MWVGWPSRSSSGAGWPGWSRTHLTLATISGPSLAQPGFCSERLREDEPLVARVGGAIGPFPHGNRRIHRGSAIVDDDRAILLDMSGPQQQAGMRVEVLIGSDRETARAGARRIEGPEIAHRAP